MWLLCSQSRQNVLSSSSKSNESFNAAVAAAAAIDPEAAHAQASGVSSTNNFNRLEFRSVVCILLLL